MGLSGDYESKPPFVKPNPGPLPNPAGEALGMRLTVNKITQIAIPVVFGGIGTVFGLTPVFWANAAFLLASGVLSVRDGRAPPSA